MNRCVYLILELNTINNETFVVGTFSTLRRVKECFDISLINRDENATTYWQVYKFYLNMNHYESPNRKLVLTTFNIV